MENTWTATSEYFAGQSLAFWVATAIALVALCILLWLIVRALRLWYWKVNRRTASLENIEKKLDAIQERMDKGGLVKVTVTDKRQSDREAVEGKPPLQYEVFPRSGQGEVPPKGAEGLPPLAYADRKADEIADKAAKEVEESIQSSLQAPLERQGEQPARPPHGSAAVISNEGEAGVERSISRKSGKLYTREEIERLIRN